VVRCRAVYETQEQLTELQRVLDESYKRSGSHLRSIITPARRLSAADVSRRLTGMCLLHLGTVTAKGEPRVAPVDGQFFQGKLWFGSARDSARFRHIRQRPQVSANHTRGEQLVVIVHGIAHEIDTSTGEYEGFRGYLREVYGPKWDSWGYWESASYAWIEPQSMFAAQFETSGQS